MKPKTRFLKMYYKLPKAARQLCWTPFTDPRTLNVIALEVRNNTKLSEFILREMGYTEKADSMTKEQKELIDTSLEVLSQKKEEVSK